MIDFVEESNLRKRVVFCPGQCFSAGRGFLLPLTGDIAPFLFQDSAAPPLDLEPGRA